MLKLKKLLRLFLAHKIISSIIIILSAGGGYYSYKMFAGDDVQPSYVMASVEKGTLITSVSGSGQISASNQLDIKPKVSGDIVWAGARVSQEVRAGQTLFSLDDTDAKKEIADAELAIEETQLNLDKAVAQAPIDYESKLESLRTAKDNLEKEYENIFSTVSNSFLSLPTIITYAQNVLYGTDLSGNSTQWNVNACRNLFLDAADKDLVNSFADIAEKDYKIARNAYDANFLKFKSLTLYSSESDKEEMLEETFEATRAIAQAIKSEINLFDTMVDITKKKNQQASSTITTFQTNLRNYLTTSNNNLSTLLSQKASLKNAKTTITNTENAINILKINNPTGDNPIDLQISKNNIEQKKISLADLKAKLAYYAVRASFDGIISDVNVKKGDSVSSGTSLATIISHQKIAEVSLNEVDVAQVKVGQKATLAFDALEDLSIVGEVGEVDVLGAVSQGVVNYAVKIVFDTDDDRIKPGMSISAAIITNVKQDVLMVPNSAVQSNGEQHVVVLENGVSRNQVVETGLSNDTMTEIISGLKEGDSVVTQTITSGGSQTSVKTNSNSRSGFMMMGGGPR